jgi:hypothetical protein
MRSLSLLAALLLLLLLGSGAASASVGINNPDHSGETIVISNQASAPLTFSGSNDQVTQPFSWDAGIMIVSWTDSDGLLIVHLVDMNGEIVEYLVSQYDEGPGSAVVNVPRSGQYRVDVEASSSWTITLSTSLYSTTSTAFSGTNNQATPTFYCNTGGLTAAWTVNDGLFIVHLVDTNGEIVDYLASQYDKGPGSTIISIKKAGYYMLSVEAGSPWTITLSGAIQSAPTLPTSAPTTPPTVAPVNTPPTQPPVEVTSPPTPQPTQGPVTWTTSVGQGFVLSGAVTRVSSGLPAVGSLIVLQAGYSDGTWMDVGTALTDENGKYSFTLVKSVPGVYTYRSVSNGQVLGGEWIVTVNPGSTTIPTTVATLQPISPPVVPPEVTLAPASGWGKRYTVGDPGSYLGSRAGSSTAPTGTGSRRVASTTGTALKPGSRSYGTTPPASGSFVRWYPAARWAAGLN